MRIFDYSFLQDISVPARILSLISSVSEMKVTSREQERIYTESFHVLEDIALVNSVRSSNAIEGIVTSDLRIQELVVGRDKPHNHTEAEISGYRDALNYIHNEYGDITLSVETICFLHTVLNAYTPTKGGIFKADDNVIAQIGADGRRKVRFMPVSAKETPDAMEQLVLAYTEANSNPNIHKLLLIPCFILDFLCIHPFSDGNGRISRLLTLLLLYKAGYTVGKYISFEEQTAERKSMYYDALYSSSAGWHENSNDCFPFIDNFAMTLFRCYSELDSRFTIVNGNPLTKAERIKQAVLCSITPISKSDIAKLLPDVGISTIEAVLAKLVKDGTIEKIGSARNVRYRKKA